MSRVDIAVIPIREDETAAVLSRIACHRAVPRSNRTYAVGELENKHCGSLSIASIRNPEQGQLAAQETARNIIEDLNPSWIAVVGICGAVPDSEFTVGDVIVASRLHAFTLGVIKEDERPQFTDLRGPLSRRAEDLVCYIKALEPDLSGWEADHQIGLTRPEVKLTPNSFYGSDERKRQTKKILAGHFDGPGRRTRPIVTTRPVASSDFLIKDTASLEGWRSSARHVSGVEMELAGTFEAARRRGREYPILAVRGISDIIGFRRSADWTQYACGGGWARPCSLLLFG